MSSAATPGPSEIGARLRTIRKRRGLSLPVAADRAGISKQYLSFLERGERSFTKRGLLEDLARAVGCAVTDLTGQPFLPADQASAEALATLPGISVALYDNTLDDVVDGAARPLDELVRRVHQANEHSAAGRYGLAGQDLGDLLTELHIHAVTGNSDVKRIGLATLVEAAIVAYGSARTLGNHDLAVHAARRAFDAANRLGNPALMGFATMSRTIALGRLGARHRAATVVADGLRQIEQSVEVTSENSATAEACGMLHLSAAQMAAKDERARDAQEHLALASELAARTGERNSLQFSFGPANVRAWNLSIAVELGNGPATAEQTVQIPGYLDQLVTAERQAAMHFDLARAYSQAEGARDGEALRHLDQADRTAPQRIRNDPLAHELLTILDLRARQRTWELRSLKNRLGVGQQFVDN